MALVPVFYLAILVSRDFRLISKIIFHRCGGGEMVSDFGTSKISNFLKTTNK